MDKESMMLLLMLMNANDTKESNGIKGRNYLVNDNSYAVCHTDKGWVKVGGLDGKVYKVDSNPYARKVELIPGEYDYKMMVKVKSVDTGLTYAVLFHENCLLED